MNPTPGNTRLIRLVGGALLLTTGGIHLDLYITGYRSIPTIGPLFLLQIISAFTLAMATLASGRKLIALCGAGFALGTLVGYSASRITTLFGFHETRTTAGTVAGLIEVAAFVVLGTAVLADASSSNRVFRLLAPVAGALALIGFVVIDLTATSASTPSTPVHAASPNAPAHVVHVIIKNFAFVPAKLDVGPDQTIVVTNDDSVAHTLTAMPGSVPAGHFDTGLINPGKTKSFTSPARAGSYQYYCQVHNFMTGVLVVKA